jgi:hypothetical protein
VEILAEMGTIYSDNDKENDDDDDYCERVGSDVPSQCTTAVAAGVLAIRSRDEVERQRTRNRAVKRIE